MDVLRAQRRAYNDLYRAHQATTTQHAFKMDMMLSLLAAQQNQAPGPHPITTAPERRTLHARPSWTSTRVPPDPNPNLNPAVNGHGLGLSGLEVDAMPSHDFSQPRRTGHPTHDVRCVQIASLLSASLQDNNVYSTKGFRFRSPIPADDVQVSVEPTYKTVADYEFAQRRRVPTVPGVCARQVLERPVDVWDVHDVLLKIRVQRANHSLLVLPIRA